MYYFMACSCPSIRPARTILSNSTACWLSLSVPTSVVATSISRFTNMCIIIIISIIHYYVVNDDVDDDCDDLISFF